MSYTVDKTFRLGTNEGSSQRAKNWYIIAHETANARATGRNEATYMKRNWRAAYTHYIVGDGKVYQVGEPGYVAYGALNANPYSPVQIELQHSDALFSKNYPIYIELIRDSAKKYGIPLTLDTGGHGTKGVKSHQWVSNHIGGDHQDPYSFLAKHGISKAQFAKDIANGIGKKPTSKPAKPATSNTFNIKNYHTTVPAQIKVIKADYAYKDKALKNKSGAIQPKGSIFTVKRLVYAGKYPRYELKSGLFITTRKDIVDIYKAAPAKPKPPKPTPPVNTGKWWSEKGKFYIGEPTPNAVNVNVASLPLTFDASGNGTKIADIPKGSYVEYDMAMNDGKYIWIRQPRGNGKFGYMATGNVKNGKRVDYWGRFK